MGSRKNLRKRGLMMKSPKFEFRIILIFVLAALALLLLTIDSEGYDLPKGHMVIKTVEIEFTDSYKTILFVDKDEDYKCDKCELEPYCKWCPARGWLENRNFATCDLESRRWAQLRKKSYEDRS